MIQLPVPRILATSLLLLAAHMQFAEIRTWTDKDGNTYEAELVNAFGPMAYFRSPETGFTPFLSSNLVEADQALVQKFREAKEPHPWKSSKSKLTTLLKGRLYTLVDGETINYEFGDQPEPEFYVLYFVGSESEEGTAFTPKLVSAYNNLKASGLTNFEVILFSQDRSADDQKQYMKDMAIPFPNVKWPSRKWLKDLTFQKGKGEVNLVIMDQEGNILQRSVEGRDNLKPVNTLLSLNNLLAWTNPDNPVILKSRFVAFLQNYLQENPADAAPRMYQFDLSGIDFTAIPGGVVKVKLKVMEDGFVDHVEVLSDVPETIQEAILKASRNWLFIPKIQDGAFHASTIAFPIQNKAG